ncbi:basic proline-rich protein-like [Lepus europaeus]|uniref:basic proline-rich protein-like n=1 Tax=Lepus europaeus TaxID=9983 RepID=UPI002B4A6C58|nr:basic proline-rich protein-like [Lepus europaeus]
MMTVEIPRAPSPREVLGCYPGVPKLRPPPPRPPRARETRGPRAGPAPSSHRAPPGADRPGRAQGIPAEHRRAGAGEGAALTGVPVAGVRTAQVKCRALPAPAPTGRGQGSAIRPGTPTPHPAPRSGSDPTRDPAHQDPPTPASPPGGARRALLTPLSPGGPVRLPGGRAPLASHSAPLASRSRTCARRRRRRRRRSPAPFGSAGAAPNPTHIATHSPLTSPSPRPAHVTAETLGFPQTPPPSPAARGRARAAGRGEGRGTEPAAAPRARARAGPPASPWPPAGGSRPPPTGAARAVWPIVAPQGAPGRVRARARPSPQARARHSWPRAPSGRLARGAVCGAPGADRMFPPRPTPTAARPPSFLESPSRLSGAASAPPPPHPLLCGDGPDPGAPCRSAAAGQAGRGGAAARCTVRDPSSRQGGGGSRPAPRRRRPRSGAGDPPPAGPQLRRPAPEVAGRRPPRSAPRAGAAPRARPRGASRPGRPASCPRASLPRRPPPRRLPGADLWPPPGRAGREGWQSSGTAEGTHF